MKLFIFAVVSLLLFCGCSTYCPLRDGKLIDLTYDFSDETIYWPTSDKFKLEKVSEGQTEKGFYYSAYKFCAAEHGGTHIDAPIHFASGGKTLEQISLEKLKGEAVVIDVSEKVGAYCNKPLLCDNDYQITVEDITSWESKNGKIPDASIVLLYTGYSKFWGDSLKYLGTNKRGIEGVNELHFPGLHPNAAEWLVENRKIKAVGLDTASVDYGQSKDFKAHQILCGSDVLIFENVANLDKLPTKGAYVIALPMKIKGGSGGPTRIIALVP